MNDAMKAGATMLLWKLGLPVLLVGGLLAAVLFGGTFLIAGASGQVTAANCSAPSSNVVGVASVGDRFDASQIANVKTVVSTAKSLGLDGRAARIAVVAAVGESDLTNLDHGDTAGPDSRGLFQQRPSQGWGTEAQTMDPAYATTSFLTGPRHDRAGGLVAVAGWAQLSETEAIHRVQRNADPNHYARFAARADAAIKSAGVDVGFKGQDGSYQAVSAANVCGSGAALAGNGNANDDYPFKAQTPLPGIYVTDPFGYYFGECTSWAAWAFNRDHGHGVNGTPKYSLAAGNFANGNAATWRTAWESRGWPVSSTPQRGAIAWWGANGALGVGDAGHVAYVEAVNPDGSVLLSEYNNAGLAPPGHRFDVRTVKPSDVNAFLLAPAA